MTTGATGQLGLALPVQGELSGTWGDTVNNGITQYANIAIAATLTLTNDGAVTLANTTGDASASNITSTLTGAGTVTAQFAIVRVTGTLTVAKVVTAPAYSKTYVVVNAATGGIVTFKAAGQTGVSIAVGESAFVYFNGTDYVKVSSTVATGVTSFTAGTTGLTPNTATTGAVTLAGTLGTANGGTNLTSFTSGGVVYASSSSVLATGSALTFDGTNFAVVGGNATINRSTNTSRLTLGGSPSANWEGDIQFVTSNTQTNWRVSSNQVTSGAFTITPSTAGGGSTFTTPAVTIDNASNLGLGVTPSAWSGIKAFQVSGQGSSIWGSTAVSVVGVNSNGYNDGTNWRYINSAAAGMYQIGATHAWNIAASGTAGNTITFTQAMTLDASGNLGVGTTSPVSKIHGYGTGQIGTIESSGDYSSAGSGFIRYKDSTGNRGYIGFGGTTNVMTVSTTLTSGIINFEIAGAERARITYSGGFSVGTTADPGAGAIYATGNITAYYSDKRLKTVSGKIENALDKVAQLSGVYYTNNSVAKSFGYDSDEVQVGVLAQDVEAVLPQIVKAAPFDLDENGNSKSGENYKTVQYERLVPLLIEAINELRAEVKALKGA